MRRHQVVIAAAFFLALQLLGTPADAWLRRRYEDAEVVARSELIVVGAIKDGSVQYVPHKTDAEGGRSWEHHAILIVHEVLKGECGEKEIPIIIHYGLEPLVNGHSNHDGFEMNSTSAPSSRGAIEIVDEGNSQMSFGPLVPDARADNIWLLRRNLKKYGEKTGDAYGIVDPEDVQPLSLKYYLLCYLGPSPEAAVRAQLQAQPEIARRAIRYLLHLEIARIMKESDPVVRVERLLPYYLSRATWNDENDAENGIVSAGNVAGPYLRGVYDATPDENVQEQIIRLWGATRYTGCVDLLIEVLSTEDSFWSKQDLKPGWWNAEVESELTQIRRANYGKVYAAVYTLARIGDTRAKHAIEQTRNRWAAIHFENPQIVETCDAAIKAFDAKAATKP
jgi:hypothetical protein